MILLGVLHIVLFGLALIILGVAVWSIFNYPKWDWKSYVLVVSSLVYIGGTFIINGVLK